MFFFVFVGSFDVFARVIKGLHGFYVFFGFRDGFASGKSDATLQASIWSLRLPSDTPSFIASKRLVGSLERLVGSLAPRWQFAAPGWQL